MSKGWEEEGGRVRIAKRNGGHIYEEGLATTRADIASGTTTNVSEQSLVLVVQSKCLDHTSMDSYATISVVMSGMTQ